MKDEIVSIAKGIGYVYFPIPSAIYEISKIAIDRVSKASESGTIDELKDTIMKQKLELDFAKSQAQIEQELAIARRIDNAEEVEIEEYYELSGKGQVGIDINEQSSISAGLSANGSKVTKRIYRFKSKQTEKKEDS